MAQVGLKNLYYAPIAEDGAGRESYGKPIKVADAISADLSVNNGDATLYGDDKVYADVREFINATIALAVCDLPASIVTALMGARIDNNGVLISSQEDKPHAVAIGFESKCADGESRFFWFYRVTFGIPGAQLRTKGESIEFATPTIEGKIENRHIPDENGTHPWKTEHKSDGTDNEAQKWFDFVYNDGVVADLIVKSGSTVLPLDKPFDPNATSYGVVIPQDAQSITVEVTSGYGVNVKGYEQSTPQREITPMSSADKMKRIITGISPSADGIVVATAPGTQSTTMAAASQTYTITFS